MMDSAVALRTQLKMSFSPARRMRRSVDQDVITSKDNQTVDRSHCPSVFHDRPWPSATPFEDDEPDEDCLTEGPEGLTEVVDQPTTTWDWFDEHIRCIATADPKEQYVRKPSTDKGSETYKAAMREINGSPEWLEAPDSDEELATATEDSSKDEALVRQMSVESSRKTHRKIKDVGEQSESDTRTASVTGWRRESASGMHPHQQLHLPYQQQQQQQQQYLDEYATKRTMLYEKYLERQNAWADGLTKSGKDILLAIQRRKRSTRFPVSPSTNGFHRPDMVRNNTWCSTSNANSGFHAFNPTSKGSLSWNG